PPDAGVNETLPFWLPLVVVVVEQPAIPELTSAAMTNNNRCHLPTGSIDPKWYRSEPPSTLDTLSEMLVTEIKSIGSRRGRQNRPRLGVLQFGVLEQAGENDTERFELILRNQVEEATLHLRDVPRCRSFDGLPAGFGQLHHQSAPVVGAFLASHQNAPLHPRQMV